MLTMISQMLSYSFITRALLVGVLVSLCAALLGIPLVLKRYSMIGDGLSHVGFGTMAIAVSLQLAPLAVSIPVMVVAAFLLLRISENGKMKGDAAIALISSSAMAIGVLVSSLSSGINIDIESFMFGSNLAITTEDVWLCVPLTVAVLVLYVIFYNRIFAVTFDENFSRATGTRVDAYNLLLAFLTAITIVVGMRMMGTLLMSSLIIFPALSAMRVCSSFRRVVITAAALSVVCFAAGIFFSFAYSVPPGASVVVVNLGAFLLCMLIGAVRRKAA